MSVPRLSAQQQIALSTLREIGGAAYGLQIVRASRGKLNRGSIYNVLSKLEALGFVQSEYIDTDLGAGVRRRIYRITGPVGVTH